MQHYLEIKVLPDLEANSKFLMNNLLSKLHAALGVVTDCSVGVSFPGYSLKRHTLGEVVRLHGKDSDLKALMTLNWMKGLNDYCEKSDIMDIPDNVQYRHFSRHQKKSAHNKRRRQVLLGRLTEAEALEKFPDEIGGDLPFPFVQMVSRSNHQHMKIFVEMGPVIDNPTYGKFNSYGLSRKSENITVPWF